MQAAVWTGYGPPEVLQLKTVDRPIPRGDEVLIRVHATTVTTGDCEMRALRLPFGLKFLVRMYCGLVRPKRITILGQELAGQIELVGENVRRFVVGEPIFAATGLVFGAHAEYVCLPQEAMVARIPANMTAEEAAAIPMGSLNALHFLRAGAVRRGQHVMIVGAGGSIGTAAVQIAKAWGAQVTAVDAGGKLEALRALGADHVFDYTQEDFTTGGASYDAIFDIVGKTPFSKALRLLKAGGSYLLGNPTPLKRIRGLIATRTSGKLVFTKEARFRREDLTLVRELIESGKLKSVIDRRYPLEKIVEAHRFVETGQKRGNVVITVLPRPSDLRTLAVPAG